MMDVDLLVLQDLSPIENLDFDLAYTTRKKRTAPVNSGVVFVRVSERTKVWYEKWYENVLNLLESRTLFSQWRRRYGGINQCGLGMLLESSHDLKLLSLPCQVWNLCYDEHNKIQSGTKIVHIHGGLRMCLFHNRRPIPHPYRQLVKLWRGYEEEMLNGSKKV
jgi:hypothetical protein